MKNIPLLPKNDILLDMSTVQALEKPFFNRQNKNYLLGAEMVTGDESLAYQQGLSAQRRGRALQGMGQLLPSLTQAATRLAQAAAGGFGVSIMDHALVPFLGLPTYLRLVDTIAEVKAYSAGGFHVAVARGLVGGAGDNAVSFGKALLTGRKPLAPQRPLNRADLVEKWKAAAGAYKSVFDTANAGPTFFLPLVDQLREANSLADQAYAAEGIAPPKDPGPGTTEVPSEPKSGTVSTGGNGLYYGMGIAAAGLFGFFLFRPTYKGKDSQHHKPFHF